MLSFITNAKEHARALALTQITADEFQHRDQRPLWLSDHLDLPNGQSLSPTLALKGNPLTKRVEGGFTQGIGTIQRFKTETVDPFFKDLRTEHLKEISLDEDVLTEEQKFANQQFTVASVGVMSTAVCLFLYPPLVLLHLPLFFYVSVPLFKEAYEDLVKKRRVTTAVVDATLCVGAIAYVPFEPAIFVIGTIGSWVYTFATKIVTGAKDGTRKRLTNLMGEQPQTVWIVRNGVEVEVPFETVQIGDLVVIDAGQMIPVDGLIQQGVASIDQHTLTGEAQPAEKSIGDPVLAATVVLAGRIIIQVQKTGQETAVAQVGQMLLDTAEFTSSVELRGKEISDRAALPTLILGGLSLPLVGPSRALAILFSGVGYNMKILGPLSVLNYLQRLAHQGILIKDGRALEQISQIDTVVFDKTGTLTLEQPHVYKIHTWDSLDEESVLRHVASAEQRQSHPIAKAVLQEATTRNLTLPTIGEAAYEVGYGIQVTIDAKRIRVGSQRYMQMEAIPFPDTIPSLAQEIHDSGHSLVYVAIDDRLVGAIELQPTVRPEAKQLVEFLRDREIETYIISGDHEAPTQALATQLGINNYFAETLPEQKAGHIAQLQAAGKSVCFIGDGINDAIALKQAQVSISLRGATTLATDTAQIIMMDQTLAQLPVLFASSEEFEGNMQKNLLTTVVPGVVIIGGALVGLVSYGASIVFFSAGLTVGVVNAMLPRLEMKTDR